MPFLLPLLALLLLSAAPTVTEVVASMSECDDNFLYQAPPQIKGILEGGNILDQNRYKPICQTLNNKRTFVTLYDTTNKIPVFSAYNYTGKERIDRLMIEPQLEEITLNKNMEVEDDSKCYIHQAVSGDYSNSPEYIRGNLLPQSYGLTKNHKKSTFTMTNIVPQVKSFNTGSWSNMEKCVQCVLDKYCINNNGKPEGFVVIGARPSNNHLLNNKVNIPSMLWSAFCCYSKSQGPLAGAHWGDNTEDGETVLQTKTLAQLHRKLGGRSEVFPGTNCPLYTTVTDLYPNLNKACKCPAPTTTKTTAATTSTTKVTTTTTTTTKKREKDENDKEREKGRNDGSSGGDMEPANPIPGGGLHVYQTFFNYSYANCHQLYNLTWNFLYIWPCQYHI
ncbi:uncharacterized protein LOC132996278 [Limanda limanda]|uniref:uncharacterized protein LOC132996278 n=1 Tax=Limanda limanda TaxID=27771 RepID=UPI0029C6DD57|nr:uncharacterized protein LOC132996278 [Limanda limanda]